MGLLLPCLCFASIPLFKSALLFHFCFAFITPLSVAALLPLPLPYTPSPILATATGNMLFYPFFWVTLTKNSARGRFMADSLH
jgi:hypothetical protein